MPWVDNDTFVIGESQVGGEDVLGGNVPVALQDNAIVTYEDASVFLRMTGGAEADKVRDTINKASDECEAYTRRPLKQRAFSNLRFRRQEGTNLRPRATPISAEDAITISLDGRALSVWASELDGDPALKDVLLMGDESDALSFTHFYREQGWWGASMIPIVVSFTGGIDPIPGDLREACLLVCQTLLRHEKGGGGEVQALGPGPVQQSVTFRSGEALSLAPAYAKQVLDRFRMPQL